MNRKQLQGYIDYTLQALDNAPIPFHSNHPHTELLEATGENPLMLIAFDSNSNVSLKIEFAASYIGFDLELEMCDSFLPARFSYEDNFEQKVSDFFAVVEIALSFKSRVEAFIQPKGSGTRR